MKPEQQIRELIKLNLNIKKLGEQIFTSPIQLYDDDYNDDYSIYIPDNERVYTTVDATLIKKITSEGLEVPSFEKAGPREKLFFESGKTVSAIVTCGGLCPGLNAVIRGIVLMNKYRYGNGVTYGFRYGYAGMIKELGHEVVELTPETVTQIQTTGGTILGSSRGNQDPVKMVDRLVELGVNVLYAIGGDGTQRGAMQIIQEIEKRGLKISVIGVPKTIDNDINFIDKSFGIETAFSEACIAIHAAHIEAKDAYYGIGVVKLMGRDSGFITANAALATGQVNVCLIPEQDFDLEGEHGVLKAIEKRILSKKHCVVVVAEGAGQKYVLDPNKLRKDPSGNVRLGDIGVHVKDAIKTYFDKKKIPVAMRYIDPSYMIRSCAPTPNDSIFCLQLAQMAVHAGMSGRTGLVVGYTNGNFTHLPMEVATSKRKKIDLMSQLWQSVLETTGQQISFLKTKK
jgi:6-phosphofructokinase 1